MRDPNRIPVILERLSALWRQCPDMRLGQLIVHLSRDPRTALPNVLDIEDHDLLEAIGRQLGTLSRTASVVGHQPLRS